MLALMLRRCLCFQVHRPSLATREAKTDEEVPPVAVPETAEAGELAEGAAEPNVPLQRHRWRTESNTGR